MEEKPIQYESCDHHLHGISIEEKIIRNCCLTTPSGCNTPILEINYDGETIDWEKIFARKLKNIEYLKKKKLGGCKNCYALEFKEWDEEKFISHINFNHWTTCNSRCVYCDVDKKRKNTSKRILPSIKNLVDLGLFKNSGEITFQGGEPTLLEEFEDLLSFFIEKKTTIRIHSSGIIYSPAIGEGINQGLVSIVISPDAGSKKVYEKLKKVKYFKKVWSNIAKYKESDKSIKSNLVSVKYIIVPGYNDNIKELNNWLNLIKLNNITSAIIDFEYTYTRKNIHKISPHLYMLLDYIREKLNQNNIKYSLYDSAIYAMKCKSKYLGENLSTNSIFYKTILQIYRILNKQLNIKYPWKKIVN